MVNERSKPRNHNQQSISTFNQKSLIEVLVDWLISWLPLPPSNEKQSFSITAGAASGSSLRQKNQSIQSNKTILFDDWWFVGCVQFTFIIISFLFQQVKSKWNESQSTCLVELNEVWLNCWCCRLHWIAFTNSKAGVNSYRFDAQLPTHSNFSSIQPLFSLYSTIN